MQAELIQREKEQEELKKKYKKTLEELERQVSKREQIEKTV